MFSTIFVPLYILLRFPKYLVLQDCFYFEDLSICCEKKWLKPKKKKKKFRPVTETHGVNRQILMPD